MSKSSYMWEIYEHRRVARQLNKIPIQILQRYEIWKEIVMASGPEGLRRIRGFNDEALQGDWKRHRSARLSLKYRVVYSIEKQEIKVEVVSIAAHDYRRR